MQPPLTPLEASAAEALRVGTILGIVFRVIESCMSLSFSGPLFGPASVGLVALTESPAVHFAQFAVQALAGLGLAGVLLFASRRVRQGDPRWTRRARLATAWVAADVVLYLLGLLGAVVWAGWAIAHGAQHGPDHVGGAGVAMPIVYMTLALAMEVGLLICAVRAYRLLRLLETVQPAPLLRG
ncbi:hypothetical protein R8Z50_07665 [Longispora sp. K20-0274]|uniref:hypothetical protein n=1 Tax=Longispora sp. K20-0274 TaxID=3088255 RepID=UPI00399BEA94